MKHSEFEQNNEKTVWIDTACSMEKPSKVTILKLTDFHATLEDLLGHIDLLLEEERKIDADRLLLDILKVLVMRRRAWVHGDDVEFVSHVSQLVPAFFQLFGERAGAIARDDLKYLLEKEEDENNGNVQRSIPYRIRNFLEDLMREVYSHMNPNTYVVHEVQDYRRRDFMLLEFHDWRAIQWTQQQIDLKREQNNDI